MTGQKNDNYKSLNSESNIRIAGKLSLACISVVVNKQIVPDREAIKGIHYIKALPKY